MRTSSKALSDLDGIRDYSRQQWGARQTAEYLRLIRAAIAAAAHAPLQAAAADHYRSGYRKTIAGAHRILFRVNGDTIEIVRILPAAMDIGNRID